MKSMTFKFDGKKYIQKVRDLSEEGNYSIDPSQSPKTIDLDIKTGNDKGKKQVGIYKREDNRRGEGNHALANRPETRRDVSPNLRPPEWGFVEPGHRREMRTARLGWVLGLHTSSDHRESCRCAACPFSPQRPMRSGQPSSAAGICPGQDFSGASGP